MLTRFWAFQRQVWVEPPGPARRGGPGWGALSADRSRFPSPGPRSREEEAGSWETLSPRGGSGSHPPLEPVKSSSSVASTQSTGLVWPSAMETHCSGAVLAPLAPPTAVMMPLPGREGERRLSVRGRGQAERGSGVRGTRRVSGAPGTAPGAQEPQRQGPVVRPLSHHPERFQAARPARHSRGSEQTGPACGGSPLTLPDPEPEAQTPPGQSRVGEAPELGGSSATSATPGRVGGCRWGGRLPGPCRDGCTCRHAHTPGGTSTIRPVSAIRTACSAPREGRPGPAASSYSGLERPCLPASRQKRPVLSGPRDPATPQPAEALRRKSLFSAGVSGTGPQPH